RHHRGDRHRAGPPGSRVRRGPPLGRPGAGRRRRGRGGRGGHAGGPRAVGGRKRRTCGLARAAAGLSRPSWKRQGGCRMIIRSIALSIALLAFAGTATTADAQARKGKKLYCWNDANGNRTCGDTLPPGATDLARTEINAASGSQTREVARALTEEELAAAAAAQAQAQADAKAEAERLRRDMAMVESYASEADLRRAYGERT